MFSYLGVDARKAEASSEFSTQKNKGLRSVTRILEGAWPKPRVTSPKHKQEGLRGYSVLEPEALVVTTNNPNAKSSNPDIYFGYSVEQKAMAFPDALERRSVARVVDIHKRTLWASSKRYIGTVLTSEGLNVGDGETPERLGYVRLWWGNSECPNSDGFCGRWDPYENDARGWQVGDVILLNRAIEFDTGMTTTTLGTDGAAWIMQNTVKVGWQGGGTPGLQQALLTVDIPQCNWHVRFRMRLGQTGAGTAASFGFKDATSTSHFLLDAPRLKMIL